MNVDGFKSMCFGLFKNIFTKKPENKMKNFFHTGFPSSFICKTVCKIVHASKEVRISPKNLLCYFSTLSSVYLESIQLLALLQGKQSNDSLRLESLGISYKQPGKQAVPIKSMS